MQTFGTSNTNSQASVNAFATGNSIFANSAQKRLKLAKLLKNIYFFIVTNFTLFWTSFWGAGHYPHIKIIFILFL